MLVVSAGSSSSVSAGYIIEFMLEDLEAVPADYVPAGHSSKNLTIGVALRAHGAVTFKGVYNKLADMLSQPPLPTLSLSVFMRVQPSCHDEYASEYKNDPDFHLAIEDIKCSIPTEFTWQDDSFKSKRKVAPTPEARRQYVKENVTRMNQAGLVECIVRAVDSCHPHHLHLVLYERESEMRPLVPDVYQSHVRRLQGGSLLASSPDFDAMCVTKAEYEELGSYRCRRGFFH
ncbi:actin-related protein 6 [Tanacetum coccineum]